MARAIEEPLARARRRALLWLAAILALPLGFVLRHQGTWTTFVAAAGLLIVLMAFGTRRVFGPFVKDESLRVDEHRGPHTPSPHGRGHDEQLTLAPSRVPVAHR